MHKSSLAHMRHLAATYLTDAPKGRVVDIGAMNINGSYRPIFEELGWEYLGLDLEAGPGVDIVAPSPNNLPISSGSVDLVVSGQALEHMSFFWLTWLEIMRIIRTDGMIFMIAPSRGPEHRYPVDCWRFYPDSYRALALWGGMDLLHVSTDWDTQPDENGDNWGDTVGVFRKPALSFKRRTGHALMQWLGKAMIQNKGA